VLAWAPVLSWEGAPCAPLPAPGITGAAPVCVNIPASMRKPHTSQKSSLADWWPAGQVAIATPS
jgi:hypothetical protein